MDDIESRSICITVFMVYLVLVVFYWYLYRNLLAGSHREADVAAEPVYGGIYR